MLKTKLHILILPPTEITCGEGKIKCFNGRECIAKENVCNGLADCADSSDERDCGKTMTLINLQEQNSLIVICTIVFLICTLDILIQLISS